MSNSIFFYTISDGYSGKTIIEDKDITTIFNILNIKEGNIDKLNTEINSKDFTCNPFNITEIVEYISHSICIYLVNNDKVTGICCINLLNRQITISFLCVPPKNSGNGKILLNKIKELSCKIGYTITIFSMPNVILYYKKNGFEIEDEEINEVSKIHNVNEDDFDKFGVVIMSYNPPMPPMPPRSKSSRSKSSRSKSSRSKSSRSKSSRSRSSKTPTPKAYKRKKSRKNT